MSFIGNIATAQTAKKLGEFNNSVLNEEAKYIEKNAEIRQKVYDTIEKPRLIDQQQQEYSNFFVNALKSGAEFREGDTPFFVGIKNKSNQMLDLALSDYNTKVTVNHMDNQSLLLQARGRGELFKGKLTARAEYMKATGSLLTMGYESDKQGRLVIL